MRKRNLFYNYVSFSMLLILAAVSAAVLGSFMLLRHYGNPDYRQHPIMPLAILLGSQRSGLLPEDALKGIVLNAELSAAVPALYIVAADGKILAALPAAPRRLELAPGRFEAPAVPLQPASLYPGARSPADPVIVKLSSDPERFLIYLPASHMSGPEGALIPVLLVLGALLSGGAFALSSVFVRRKLEVYGLQATQVMQQLQSGDLKARLPIRDKNEIGALMEKFNFMADEIERLVQAVKKTERSRTEMLQELGHDLRTPMSSLYSLLEMVRDKSGLMTEDEKSELLSVGMVELKYLHQLVEDLLLLSRVEDPTTAHGGQTISLQKLVAEELESRRMLGQTIDFVNKIDVDHSSAACIPGNSHLLKRLLRNSLDNAFDYAKSRVAVSLQADEGWIDLLIDDDGPGLSDECLRSFGAKRPTRVAHESQGLTRVSLGLGSVIIKAAAAAHRGSAEISNRIDQHGVILGARLHIRIPQSKSASTIPSQATDNVPS